MRSRPVILVLVALLASLVLAPPAGAGRPSATGADCNLPESDADALVILNFYYPNKYVWDDTHLTAAVQGAPHLSEEHLEAVRAAIAGWDEILRECFDDRITLTDVTDEARNAQSADIVLHYVPRAGGVVFAGYAICGANGCPNVLVRSDFAPGQGIEDYEAEYLYYVALHELGHALGLGHATNLTESTDLMGYGWIGDAPDPVFSQCDLDALAYLFGPALSGGTPRPPGPSTLEPTFDCGT